MSGRRELLNKRIDNLFVSMKRYCFFYLCYTNLQYIERNTFGSSTFELSISSNRYDFI